MDGNRLLGFGGKKPELALINLTSSSTVLHWSLNLSMHLFTHVLKQTVELNTGRSSSEASREHQHAVSECLCSLSRILRFSFHFPADVYSWELQMMAQVTGSLAPMWEATPSSWSLTLPWSSPLLAFGE